MANKRKTYWHIDIIQKKNVNQEKTNKKKEKNNVYCCSKFKMAVKESIIIQSKVYDETEWYMPEGYHIYYCPFCGKLIKGKGFGRLVKAGIKKMICQRMKGH